MSRSTLEEAARGVTKTVEFPRSKACDTCKGTGSKPGSQRAACRHCDGHGQIVQSAGILRVQTTCPACHGAGSIITDPCDDCRGRGYVQERAKLDVTIPAGIDNGMRVRLAGYGEPSPDGGPPGDCYCFVTVKKHKLFQREGTHLILRMPISYSQAALGATIEVPTLAGPHELTMPARHAVGRGVPRPRPRHARSARRFGRRFARADLHRSAQKARQPGRKSCSASWPSWSRPKSRRTASRSSSGSASTSRPIDTTEATTKE